MSDNFSYDPEELRFAEVLRFVEEDAPPPDREFLASLRQRTTEIFVAHHASLLIIPPIAGQKTASRPPTPPQRPAMTTLAIRGVAALVAAVSLISAWFASAPDNAVRADVPFSAVLQELRGAESLRMRLLKDQHTVEVWVRRPGLVRRDESPRQYEIARGSRLWKIDETANTVTEGDSRWFLNPEKQIDLLGLLEVGVTDASGLLDARPRKRAEYIGHECLVYESMVETREGQLRIVAYADAKTRQLAGIVAWPADAQLAAAGVPLAELQLIAVNAPVEEDKFVVAKSLSEDGRIGKVSASQGIVLLRPMAAGRWTPVCRTMPLKTGDWLRTEFRGANAVKLALTSEFELTIGPGTLLECISPTQARLHSGEVQVHLPKARKGVDRAIAFELLAPRTGSRKFAAAGTTLLRVDRTEQLVDVKQTPVWLAGFEGTSSNESLGSLIVQIDGRSEPLTVGYHKVNVEIRDQIARTTIEESFVNRTGSVLEGVFHFPLPQDASISGFGMWIGNNLVEADVVEKQRAREIYDEIRRQKRDPGLLEWTGGNIFKASVFPIEAYSEKRIKIVYTQVLPLRANRYRYSYGLKSELLQLTPLRELALTVTVNSALGLKDVTCPTHAARIQKTAHSGQVKFSAQEYIPNRDFEVVCEIDGRQSDVVVVPHRRGDDGYFLLQLSPPGAEGNWQREVLADGAPLKLVLLCDTSSSMDSEKRRQQREFVATVLSSLGPNDRFQLAAADVTTVWPFTEPAAPTPENLAKVRTFLDERVSLGWTDLAKAFGDVLKKAPDDAQVIYVGDGIVTAGETNPQSFVKELRRLVLGTGEKPTPQKRAFHAVTVGNSYEGAVVKGIAGLAGGSVRSIGGEQTPQTVALELLNELAQPGLRDVQVEFRGVKVAAVYPEKLPNVAAGTQQILVGRYLPEGKDQQGEIVVTGKRGSETVRYAARINLKDAEEGNSFIPRLWARGHLEQLLQQGPGDMVRDQVIALSEEFHIMTPYTSLLVLESDADRERFGVKRHYEMRDGEKFFAEGRGNADFELLQKQMKRAGDWRIGMRRQVLRSLMGLGRNPGLFSQAQRLSERRAGRAGGGFGGRMSGPWNEVASSGKPMGGTFPADEAIDSFSTLSLGDLSDSETDFNGTLHKNLQELSKSSSSKSEIGGPEELEIGISNQKVGAKDSVQSLDYDVESDVVQRGEPDDGPVGDRYAQDQKAIVSEEGFSEGGESPFPAAKLKRSYNVGYAFSMLSEQTVRDRRYRGNYFDYTSWISTLFSYVVPAPGKPGVAPKDSETWSAEALALSKSLLQKEALFRMQGGLEIRSVSDAHDPRWNRRTSRQSHLTLFTPTAWLSRTLNLDAQTVVQFCNARERGAYSLAFLLGRIRGAVAQDLQSAPLSFHGGSMVGLHLVALHESYSSYHARVEPAGPNRATLIFSTADGVVQQRLLIDTARRVMLKQEIFQQGKLTQTSTYDDFVQIAGVWWSRKSTVTDSQGRKTGESALETRQLTGEQFQGRMKEELAAKPRVQFLNASPVLLNIARQNVVDGKASFDDRIAMIVHFSQLQKWDDALRQVEEIEKQAVDKPGIRWLRTIILATIRRNEEARQRYLAEARTLATAKTQDELFLAEFILSQGRSLSEMSEFADLVQLLRPVFDRQPAEWNGSSRWRNRLAESYEGLGRSEEALALRKALADETPWDIYAQMSFASRLQQAGQAKAALEHVRREIDRKVEFGPGEEFTLRNSYASLLRTQGNWPELLKFTTEWIARNPGQTEPYAEHLSALYFNDQLKDAHELADRWLKEARIDGKLAPEQYGRLEAAVNLALGSTPHFYFQQIDDRWFGPLAETARFFSKHKHHFDIAYRIVGNYRFASNEACDRLRAEFLKRIQTELPNIPANPLQNLINWTLSGRLELAEPINNRKQLQSTELPLEIWEKISKELHARWSDTRDKQDKYLLGETLRTLYANRFRDTKLLPFLRERLPGAPAEYRGMYISALFEDLLTRPWTEEIEKEGFQRLRELSPAEDPSESVMAQLPALMRLVDSLLTRRQARDEQQLRDRGELDKLTRKGLAAKRAEFLKAARLGVAARLSAEATSEKNATLAAWMRIERLTLDVRLSQRLPELTEECWKIVGAAPVKPENPEAFAELPLAQQRQQTFDNLLRHRALATLEYLAARPRAEQALVERFLKYLDAGIALGGETVGQWRMEKFRFLIALDRPTDLERELRAWIASDVSTAPWRILLGHLLAELGKVPEAVGLFESAHKDQLLSAADLRLLADWYLVLNRRPDYERMRVAAFKLVPEHTLSDMLNRMSYRWQDASKPLPSQLDENVLFAYRALFEKSSTPESYFWHLREFYLACRDFRLLQMLPDAVLGRSPQQIYNFLNHLQGNVLLQELRNEASADEILAHVKQLREGERTITDLRALDLLEAIIERKSSEVLNQPGPHVEKCVAALKRAFDRKWSDGEPRMMAHFLYQLGSLRLGALRDEQLRELRALVAAATPKTRDHLAITNSLCQLLFFKYGSRDEALREMEAEVTAYEAVHAGRWPQADNEILGNYIELLENSGRHTSGETLLQKHLTHPEQEAQRQWLRNRLVTLYNHALQTDGEVSLGRGETLFKALVARFEAEVEAAPDENVRYTLVIQMTNTLRHGHARALPEARVAIHKFAFETLPTILRRQQSQYRNTVMAPAQFLLDTVGVKIALRYVIERMEQYPQRFDFTYENAWNTFGHQLAEWRQKFASEGRDDDHLLPRVLALALKELRREMRTGESRHYSLYRKHHSNYWSEKEADFVAAANEVYNEQPDSGRLATRVAQYLSGLDRTDRAIEILLISYRKGILEDDQVDQLVSMLQCRSRYGESIALLEPMIKAHPDLISHRLRLMQAYFHTQQMEQLRTLVQQIETHFHQGGRWNEVNILAFAQVCRNCDLTEKAVTYFKEAIALHKRTYFGSFFGDNWLSTANQGLAGALAKLGRTIEAVDAASEAIVCWGPLHSQRQNSLSVLKDVLRLAGDLDAYVKHLDGEVKEKGTDSAILRKAVGKVYQDHSKYAEAIVQYELAIALQPNDKELQVDLIACYDAANRWSDGTRQLLRLIDVNRHNLALYQQLVKRYEENGKRITQGPWQIPLDEKQLGDRILENDAEAERAATSLVEAAPNEFENHVALAELRQTQGRWEQAIPHWERVAQLRRLEPTGLLKLAEAQLHEKHWDDARHTIDKLGKVSWPGRFGDMPSQIQRLQGHLPK